MPVLIADAIVHAPGRVRVRIRRGRHPAGVVAVGSPTAPWRRPRWGRWWSGPGWFMAWHWPQSARQGWAADRPGGQRGHQFHPSVARASGGAGIGSATEQRDGHGRFRPARSTASRHGSGACRRLAGSAYSPLAVEAYSGSAGPVFRWAATPQSDPARRRAGERRTIRGACWGRGSARPSAAAAARDTDQPDREDAPMPTFAIGFGICSSTA